MNTRAKVTAFCAAGLLLLAIIVMKSGAGMPGGDEYTLVIGFDSLADIRVNSRLKYAGVPVGHVESLGIDGRRAKAVVKLHKDVRIPRDSTLEVTRDGLMGECFISVTPGSYAAGCFAPGEYVDGGRANKTRAAIASLKEKTGQMREVTSSIKKAFDNPEARKAAFGTAINVWNTSKHTSDIKETFSRIKKDSRDEMKDISANFHSVSSGFSRISKEAKSLEISGSGRKESDIGRMMENFSSAKRRMKNVSDALKGDGGRKSDQDE